MVYHVMPHYYHAKVPNIPKHEKVLTLRPFSITVLK